MTYELNQEQRDILKKEQYVESATKKNLYCKRFRDKFTYMDFRDFPKTYAFVGATGCSGDDRLLTLILALTNDQSRLFMF